jgi:hypothetical protein
MIRSAITMFSILIMLLCSCGDRPKRELPIDAPPRDQAPRARTKHSLVTPPDQVPRAVVNPGSARSFGYEWEPSKPKDIPWPLVPRPPWLSGNMPRDFRIVLRSWGQGGSSPLDLRVTGQSELPPKRQGGAPMRRAVARAAMDQLWKSMPADQMLTMAEHGPAALFCWNPNEEEFPSETHTTDITITANHHGFNLVIDGTCAIGEISEWKQKLWATVRLIQ